MNTVKLSSRAYTKMMFHAAKYPHCSVNGVLLATRDDTGRANTISIVDAIPLFHQCLHVTPMVEIALAQVNIETKRNLRHKIIIRFNLNVCIFN